MPLTQKCLSIMLLFSSIAFSLCLHQCLVFPLFSSILPFVLFLSLPPHLFHTGSYHLNRFLLFDSLWNGSSIETEFAGLRKRGRKRLECQTQCSPLLPTCGIHGFFTADIRMVCWICFCCLPKSWCWMIFRVDRLGGLGNADILLWGSRHLRTAPGNSTAVTDTHDKANISGRMLLSV